LLAIQGTRRRGRCAFVGEGNTVSFEPSRDIIHRQITLYGSWVTSLPHMEDLVEKLVLWGLRPETTVTNRLTLEQAGEAYALMNEGTCGKVAIVWPE
jgi:threonine dehydrogenase-like Zn-dependent dehydrogenase